MVSTELVLAGVSVGALSIEILQGSVKARKVLETRRNFVDESGALQARLDAATTRFKLLRAVLLGPGETKDIPPDSFFYELSSDARNDVWQALERLENVVSTGTDTAGTNTTQREAGIESGRTIPENSAGHTAPFGSLSRWGWAAWSGKDRCTKLVDDFCMWVDVIHDAIRLSLLSVEIDQRKLKRLATVSLAVQNTEISQDCALITITTSGPATPVEQLLIPSTQIKRAGSSAHLLVCQYQDRFVLLEDTINFQDTDTGRAQEGLNRAYQLGLLLNQQKSDEFLQFPFVGLVQTMNQIALVYDLPQHLGTRSSALLSRIELSQRQRDTEPSLSARVRLAYRLALSLYRQHSVGWLHKGIRSSRILLFSPKDKSRAYNRIEYAFLFGLEYARAENQESLRSSDDDFMNNLYRHPDRWDVPTSGFRRIHDIYALGVVLAEIGSWVPIKRCLGDKPEFFKDDPSAVYEEIIGKMGKVLPSQAGDAYTEIVLSCLRGDMEQDHNVPVHLKFKETVVDRLKILSTTL